MERQKLINFGFKSHKFVLLNLLFVIIFLILTFNTLNARTTFKGGIITQSKSLLTKEPKARKDLEYDLTQFNDSHLNETINKLDAVRLERRTGIGAPPDRVNLHFNKTRKEAIENIISEFKNYKDNINWPLWTENAIPTSFMKDGLRKARINCEDQSFLFSLETTWLEKLVSSKTPQFERLAIFWLNHFSVNFNMYKQKHAFYKHLKIIRKNTNGNFLAFLEDILRDPAMIVYLNNEKSFARNPNENLAREFFELFSLGEGNYGENDIKNLARHLSGNSINFITEDFHFYGYKQSTEKYSAFGKNYKNNKDFFSILKNHPSFGEFIAKKFYKEYVELNDPSKEDLAYLVNYFKKHNYEIPEMLRGVLNLKKFWESKLSLVKSPLELFYGTARTFNFGGGLFGHSDLINYMIDSGQELFNPPNIAGWPTGKMWLGGQKLEKRIKNLNENFKNIFLKPKKMDKKNSAFFSNNKYNKGLEQFFKTAKHDELAIESILVGYIPKDFDKRRYPSIRTYFYNVKFMGKKWKGIEIEFGTDVNNQKNWKELNRFVLYDGYSYPQIINNWDRSWFSDWRATKGISSSFPTGPKMKRFYQQNKETRLLIKYLLLSMEHVLEKKAFYNHLHNNIAAKSFLENRVNEVKKILNYNDSNTHTKVFAFPANYASSKNVNIFKCGIERHGLNYYDLAFSNTFDDNFDVTKLSNFKINLSELLLPDLNLNIDNINYLQLLTHEGYQLK